MIKSSILQFVPDQFKTQEIFDKAVNTFPFVFDSVPDQYITHEICDAGLSVRLAGLRSCRQGN